MIIINYENIYILTIKLLYGEKKNVTSILSPLNF